MSTIDYTFESAQNRSLSLIDHIIVSQNLINYVCEYKSIVSVDNLSDHLPVCIVIKCNLPRVTHEQNSYRVCNPQWSRANQVHLDNYKYSLDCNLREIDLPVDVLQCTDMLCADKY